MDWINFKIAVAMYLLEIKAACIINVYLQTFSLLN